MALKRARRATSAWATALLVFFLLSGTAHAAVPSAPEAQVLRTDIEAMTAAFNRGDAEPLIARTHPSLKALAGGDAAFAALTRSAVAQLRTMALTFVSQDIGTPTELYPAGDEEVCFVPRVSVMALQGRQMKSTSFMIAIRPKGGTAWTYLDGAGLRKQPDLLHRLLPALARDVPLPANTLE